MSGIRIYDRMGEPVADFFGPEGAAQALASREFGGCTIDPDCPHESEIETIRRRLYQERLKVERYPWVKIVSVAAGPDSYHRADLKGDGVLLYLSRPYGLKSDYEDVFSKMVGQRIWCAEVRSEHITLIWAENQIYHEYSFLKLKEGEASEVPSSSPEPEDEMIWKVSGTTLVYCKYCNKTHAVVEGETMCAPNAWLIDN